MIPRDGYWLSTCTGKRIYIKEPMPDDFDILDIAHGLSNVCRYGGQCVSFYSVAEHCIRGSERAASPALAFEFLLHDAAEAYVGDAVRPLVRSLPDYTAVRDSIQDVINKKFGLPAGMSKGCEIIDERMLASEARVMFMHDDKWWESPGFAVPWKDEFIGTKDKLRAGTGADLAVLTPTAATSFMPPRMAERLFLAKFAELTKDWS